MTVSPLIVLVGALPNLAAAATPLLADFAAGSTHGDYDVVIEPKCASGATTCASPSTAYLVLTPSTKEPVGCQSIGGVVNDFEFGVGGGGAPLHNGSFSVTNLFRAGVKIAVSGTFSSPSHVQGKITGLHVCGSDTYSISLPLSASPCTLLAKVGAVTALSFGKQVHPAAGSFGASYGDCMQGFGPGGGRGSEGLSFDVFASQAGLVRQLGLRAFGTTVRAVSGLGPSAVLEFLAGGGYDQTMTVVFHRPGAWALLQFVIFTKESCATGKPCPYPSPGRAAVEGRLLRIAHKLYPSLQ